MIFPSTVGTSEGKELRLDAKLGPWQISQYQGRLKGLPIQQLKASNLLGYPKSLRVVLPYKRHDTPPSPTPSPWSSFYWTFDVTSHPSSVEVARLRYYL